MLLRNWTTGSLILAKRDATIFVTGNRVVVAVYASIGNINDAFRMKEVSRWQLERIRLLAQPLRW